jgi:hypothetical protein
MTHTAFAGILSNDNRRAVLWVLGVGGAAALFALWGSSGGGGGDLEDVVTMDALDAQRRSGWDVGASGLHLSYEGISDVDAAGRADWRATLGSLTSAIAPTQPALLPYFVPTLFQVLGTTDFDRDLVPIHTRSMDHAEAEGRALADLFRDQDSDDTALLIDASGADAVAAAVSVAELFEPVFLFDNWPHPRGVVASQEVIAAALYYRPAFQRAQGRRRLGAPAVFVIDSRRLSRYRDESDAFDNRYLAKLPSPDGFQRLGIRHLLYVSDLPLAHEPDDLNDDFVALGAAGIDVKMVALSDFRPTDPAGTAYSYGGSPAPHVWFWHSYGWYAPPRGAPAPAATAPPPAADLSRGAGYRPTPRPTIFSSQAVGGFVGIGKQKPSGFGRVSVRTSRSTGAVSIGRSGSLGRARSSWYGG